MRAATKADRGIIAALRRETTYLAKSSHFVRVAQNLFRTLTGNATMIPGRPPGWERGMDRLREFLEHVKRNNTAKGNLRGLLHILIGRRIALADGTVVSGGL